MLTTLSVRGNGIGDEGVARLIEELRLSVNNTLTSLAHLAHRTLTCTGIGDEGAARLCE